MSKNVFVQVNRSVNKSEEFVHRKIFMTMHYLLLSRKEKHPSQVILKGLGLLPSPGKKILYFSEEHTESF